MILTHDLIPSTKGHVQSFRNWVKSVLIVTFVFSKCDICFYLLWFLFLTNCCDSLQYMPLITVTFAFSHVQDSDQPHETWGAEYPAFLANVTFVFIHYDIYPDSLWRLSALIVTFVFTQWRLSLPSVTWDICFYLLLMMWGVTLNSKDMNIKLRRAEHSLQGEADVAPMAEAQKQWSLPIGSFVTSGFLHLAIPTSPRPAHHSVSRTKRKYKPIILC